jgi:hypothetical protein
MLSAGHAPFLDAVSAAHAAILKEVLGFLGKGQRRDRDVAAERGEEALPRAPARGLRT